MFNPDSLSPRAIGLRIRKARKNLGLNQVELAEELGLAVQQVSRYETGVHYPPIERIRDIAKITNTPLGFFLKTDETEAVDNSFFDPIQDFDTSVDDLPEDSPEPPANHQPEDSWKRTTPSWMIDALEAPVEKYGLTSSEIESLVNCFRFRPEYVQTALREILSARETVSDNSPPNLYPGIFCTLGEIREVVARHHHRAQIFDLLHRVELFLTAPSPTSKPSESEVT